MGYFQKTQSQPGHRHASGNKGSGPKKSFNPSIAAVEAIRRAGKLTFTTLRGGMFRCNQASLGRLSRANKQTLIEKVGALNRIEGVATTALPTPVAEPMPLIKLLKQTFEYPCPKCKLLLLVLRPGEDRCDYCGKMYLAVE